MTENSAKDIISTDCLLHGSFMIKLIVKHFTPLKLCLAVLRVGEIYSYLFNQRPNIFWYLNIHFIPNNGDLTIILLNFQPLEVVSRYRDPQPLVVENYSYLFNIWDQTFTFLDV